MAVVAAGMLAAGCDIFYPPKLANGYPEPVVLRSRRAGETSDLQWHLAPGIAGVHGTSGTVYEQIEVQNLAGERLQVFEGDALEEGCRAAATNTDFSAILFEPSGARWLSEKEYREWWNQCESLRKAKADAAK